MILTNLSYVSRLVELSEPAFRLFFLEFLDIRSSCRKPKSTSISANSVSGEPLMGILAGSKREYFAAQAVPISCLGSCGTLRCSIDSIAHGWLYNTVTQDKTMKSGPCEVRRSYWHQRLLLALTWLLLMPLVWSVHGFGCSWEKKSRRCKSVLILSQPSRHSEFAMKCLLFRPMFWQSCRTWGETNHRNDGFTRVLSRNFGTSQASMGGFHTENAPKENGSSERCKRRGSHLEPLTFHEKSSQGAKCLILDVMHTFLLTNLGQRTMLWLMDQEFPSCCWGQMLLGNLQDCEFALILLLKKCAGHHTSNGFKHLHIDWGESVGHESWESGNSRVFDASNWRSFLRAGFQSLVASPGQQEPGIHLLKLISLVTHGTTTFWERKDYLKMNNSSSYTGLLPFLLQKTLLRLLARMRSWMSSCSQSFQLCSICHKLTRPLEARKGQRPRDIYNFCSWNNTRSTKSSEAALNWTFAAVGLPFVTTIQLKICIHSWSELWRMYNLGPLPRVDGCRL